MAKYLFTFTYGAAASKGLLKEGGAKREAVGRQTVEAMGGTLESFYYAIGPHDGYFICEFPDAKNIAQGLTVLRANGFTASAVQLLRGKEIDEALNVQVDYTPPTA